MTIVHGNLNFQANMTYSDHRRPQVQPTCKDFRQRNILMENGLKYILQVKTTQHINGKQRRTSNKMQSSQPYAHHTLYNARISKRGNGVH